MTCTGCQRAAKAGRLPHRWKRIGEATYCPLCLNQRYVVRTIAMTVVEPVGTLTIATGRDYSDVAPASGSYVGTSGNTLTTSRQLGVLSAA